MKESIYIYFFSQVEFVNEEERSECLRIWMKIPRRERVLRKKDEVPFS